ncbi:MAG: hypothetical protein K2L22_07525 [Muribaculaceae bacterium]|nr:hypothetical protein [Muribaculaceae bacterium]
MKKYLLTLLLLLSTLLHTSAVKKFDANPINVAIVIVEKGDSTEITKIFDYYGYTLQGSTDGYNVMTHSNGSEMRYSTCDSNDGVKTNKVIVKTKSSHKDIEKLLTELKFKKVGNIYERMIHRYNNQITQCSFGPKNTLIFNRLYNQNTK